MGQLMQRGPPRPRVNGTQIAVAKTAQQIFDARDANGNPTSGSVFAAVNSLATALQNDD